MSEDKPEDIKPLEVKVMNSVKSKKSAFDSHDDSEYEELGMTIDDIEEFENGDTSS